MGTEEGREIMFAEAQGLFLGFLPFVYLTSPIRVIFSHHFADKETEDQRDWVNAPEVPQLIRARGNIWTLVQVIPKTTLFLLYHYVCESGLPGKTLGQNFKPFALKKFFLISNPHLHY